MRIINIVDSMEPVNYGIWNAAMSTADDLQKCMIASEIWYPAINEFGGGNCCENVPLMSVSKKGLLEMVQQRKLDKTTDVIVTHGCWQFPTKWGYWLAEMGFSWVYVPHGMLDHWAMRQKALKKWLYFNLVEKRYVRLAHCVRAVSENEARSLKASFSDKVVVIGNGVEVKELNKKPPTGVKRSYLFMSRLHRKKGIRLLTKAWLESDLSNDDSAVLIIAGPDQGELRRIKEALGSAKNISYVGPVYGTDKERLLASANFFVLPSFSEGSPSAVLEAMQNKLVCLITAECNLPEAFAEKAALKIEAQVNDIAKTLNYTWRLPGTQIDQLGSTAKAFVEKNFSLSNIGLQQITLYREILRKQS